MNPTMYLLAALLLPVALPGQDPKTTTTLPAKAFLPDDHRMVAHVDFQTLRERGIWDELQASAMKLVFQQMEKEIGFPIASLDRVWMVGEIRPDEGGRARSLEVTVLEGNTALTPAQASRSNWKKDTVGGHDVLRQDHRDNLLVQPRPELVVQGSEPLVRPVLEGKPFRGMPCADILSLLSGRKDQLAWFVFDVTSPEMKKNALGRMFPGTAWAEGEEPTFLCLRLVVSGDADDPHLGLEGVMRHAREGEGVAVSERAADEWLERLRKEPTMRASLPILKRVEKQRDRADLVYSVDLGRARDAVGHAATLVVPLFRPRVEAAQVAPAVEAAPAADPKK